MVVRALSAVALASTNALGWVAFHTVIAVVGRPE